ncbi:SRPBCC family protein [Phycicoccus sp. CSK15P-2]|uniref:SRPBCC family protein n=1 Tax=Phycicoccus sp. CSK15P-2 TaxID=2807627 RepID=UPI0019522D05|nr:SRPBCC family protein [Phycicoccus sp. CSK15P-2]MBM6404041.1 SRPBCC family protein [Phycicoccus sp. CSK15P-2]
MADRTQSSTEIAAAPGEVLDVIADFGSYPEWAEQVKECRVVTEDGDGWADRVEFVLDAGAIKDRYTLEYEWDVDEDGTGVISWHLVEADLLKGLTGSYTLAEVGAGTRVTYDLEVDLTIPMIGMLKRKAEKLIIDAALSELKKRVEG